MVSAEPDRPQTRRLVLVYTLFGACLCAMIGVAILVMPRLPNVLLRYLAGLALLVALIFAWAHIATSFLTDADARRLLPKRERR